ncbi:MAG: response regulator [Candidatus Scalindua sp.]|jgi:DNA-binding NtrC family response regulator|nr:response regulator [Candidatus Scalindua sp.]MBT5305602.1 response regulator [Candidatus Scalindua sp.]MBT6047597.1 response regulator [Candidatus Scalindua sp.]MBT6225693.1 response regulator [Candidatus Scalindua sp.]MBT7212262.1 response regulator [Candidatus Scalindua sp.]
MQKHDINILIIDDDKDICESLKKILVLDSYKIKTISKPKRALPELQKKTFHLIILDLKMPEIRGEELLIEIRKINPDISVIILTAYPSVDSAVQALQSHVFDYVKKPFKINELRDTVRNALRSKMLLLEPEEELNIKIGKKVRVLRGENRLTLKQLAERTNLSVSLISQIERAESAASISTLNKIVTALNISLKDLFENI